METHPQTNSAVRELISVYNVISHEGGQLPSQLRLPPLPSLPNRTASPSNVQFRKKGGGYVVAELKAITEKGFDASPQSIARPEAAMIALLNTPAFRDALNKQAQVQFAKHLYMGSGSDLTISPLADENGCVNPLNADVPPIRFEVDGSIRERISKIPPAAAGNLFMALRENS